MILKKTSIAKNQKESVAIVIVAAGSSSRMGGSVKKEYLPLKNGTVLSENTLVFLKNDLISSITIVIPKNDTTNATKAFYKNPDIKNYTKNIAINFVEGGSTRQESVFCALSFIQNKIAPKPKIVLIHDGARPFLSEKLVELCISETQKYGASVPYLTPVDTQKEISTNNEIVRHLERSTLAAVQTPQGFLFSKIFQAHKKASLDGKTYTDDTEIWDAYETEKTHTFLGESSNIKITYPKDLAQINAEKKQMIRTGIGYDLHKLVKGRKLILGGVTIPFNKGEEAHSDGDVLLHAITDALLGASALGDIGSFFPPSDEKWKDANSSELLKTSWEKIQECGWHIENIDCVIAIEKPKFIPYREDVRASIAKILDISKEQIFVKAKTGEKLGNVGKGKVVEVFATCLLSK